MSVTVDERNVNLQKADIQYAMRDVHGRRFMWRLLSYCGIYRDVDTALPVEEMMKQLGRRQVGLYLLGILTDIDDEKVFTMMREAKTKEQEDNYDRLNEQRTIDDDSSGDSRPSHNYNGNALSEYI